MKTASVSTRLQGETQTQTPSVMLGSELEDEPPSTCAIGRSQFSGQVSDQNWKDWRWHFRNRITKVKELAKYIPLSVEEQAQIKLVEAKYPFAITPHYLSLIDINNPDDPIKKQSVPAFAEIALAAGTEDPLEERRDSVVPGLVRRYPDRVLMVLTDICPMYCRHCTRKREWQNGGWVRSMADIEPMLDYIRRNKVVRDVIISGGDPLTLSTHHLEEVLSRLRKIPHVEIIRIGTRCPVVLPQRVDSELCAMLSQYGPIWLNTHFNHPREITEESAHACDMLLRSGVPVSNQCVLLRGINDNAETQTKLGHALLKIKVRPYYLFQCDEVQGTEHLRTTVSAGLKIIERMRGHTSGLAIPAYVIDLPGGGGKVPMQPNYVVAQTEGELILRNYQGHLFSYRNPEPDVNLTPNRPRRRNGSSPSGQLAFPELMPELEEAKLSS